MKKYAATVGLVACLAVMGLVVQTSLTPAAEKQALTAVKVKKTPTGPDDPIWQEAQEIKVPFEGKEKFAGMKATVDSRAVYDDESIHFLFKWADDTKSITKGAWKYDGQEWSHQKGNEDRIALLFEINRITNFATKGCAIVCHVPAGKKASEGRFGTLDAAEKGDLWHWKAARSDPQGFADDTYLTKISEDKGGRKSDAGEGGDSRNETDDKTKPRFTLAQGKKLAADGVLLAEDTVEITDYSIFKAGDTLTYQMPKKPSGSRADITAVSRYVDGVWTVILSRKLDTGNDDDVVFNPRRSYSFAMALFDDSGDEDSYDSEVLTLNFGK